MSHRQASLPLVGIAATALLLCLATPLHAQAPVPGTQTHATPPSSSQPNNAARPILHFGLDRQSFDTCFPGGILTARSSETAPRKRIRTFDKPPKTDELAPANPIPNGLRGPIRRVKISSGRKLIALTLDMCEQRGEIAGYDGAIFDFLRKHKIRATLFAGGKWLRSHAKRASQLIADPLFELANHAEAHRNLRGLTGDRLRAEILGPQKAYEDLRAQLSQNVCLPKHPQALSRVPHRMGLFRFPFGACNKDAVAAVNDAGLLAIQWDISSGDPTPKMSARGISRQILRNAKPGSIIIAHGNGRGVHTAAGLPLAIPKLLAQGYEFVTVSELLAAGTPVITQSCYDSRPGDTDRYDRYISGHKTRKLKTRKRR